jgi:hypothetical protein
VPEPIVDGDRIGVGKVGRRHRRWRRWRGYRPARRSEAGEGTVSAGRRGQALLRGRLEAALGTPVLVHFGVRRVRVRARVAAVDGRDVLVVVSKRVVAVCAARLDWMRVGLTEVVGAVDGGVGLFVHEGFHALALLLPPKERENYYLAPKIAWKNTQHATIKAEHLSTSANYRSGD